MQKCICYRRHIYISIPSSHMTQLRQRNGVSKKRYFICSKIWLYFQVLVNWNKNLDLNMGFGAHFEDKTRNMLSN